MLSVRRKQPHQQCRQGAGPGASDTLYRDRHPSEAILATGIVQVGPRRQVYSEMGMLRMEPNRG